MQVDETVYILGAGVNKEIKEWDGFTPPLLGDFFRIALKMYPFADADYLRQFEDVFENIQRYWKKSKDDLATTNINLEDVFTLLDQQLADIGDTNNPEFQARAGTQFRLMSLLFSVLGHFEGFEGQSDIMRKFGKLILKTKSTIISFNYDTMIEASIENASGLNMESPNGSVGRTLQEIDRTGVVPREYMIWCRNNWNRRLAYGIQFDEVELNWAPFVSGKNFYSHQENTLYPNPILKLHGSLNWFTYTGFPVVPDSIAGKKQQLGNHAEDILLTVSGTWYHTRQPPYHNGWQIRPIVVTPTTLKQGLHHTKPFRELWVRAKNALSRCSRLVIIGYSFPPTDFNVRQLLLEGLSNHELDHLIVVNPSQAHREIAKQLCHYKGAVQEFETLEAYVKSCGQA